MNLKKLLCLGLLIFTVLALVACAGEEEPPVDTYYTVTYDSDGGSAVNAQSIKENDKALAPADPEKAGYEFADWYVGETAYDFDSAITADVALKAKWTKITYTITYKDGDTTLNLEPATYNVETDTFDLPAHTKQYYTYVGWYTDAECTQSVQNVTKGTTGNLTFYVKFAPKSYQITYYLDGGTNSEANPANYDINTLPLTLHNPTKAGFEFVGWYDNANGEGEKVTAITEIADTVVLHAKWEKLECNHVDADDNHKCDKCQEDFDDDVDVDDGDQAQPEPEYEYTIVYKEGDDTLTLEPDSYIFGTGTALPQLSRDHYVFVGWYTTPTFDEGTKMTSVSTTQTGNLTLYARFDVVEYTIEYQLIGGTNNAENPDTYTVANAASIELKAPTRDGYDFQGWFTSPLYIQEVSNLEGMTGNVILYAKWTLKDQAGVLTPEDIF